MTEPIATLMSPVTPGREHGLRLRLEARKVSRQPSLISFVFFDDSGAPLDGTPPGFLQSDLFGAYLYAGRVGEEGAIAANLSFVPPEGAVALEARLHRWRAAELRLVEPMRVTRRNPPQSGPDPDFVSKLRVEARCVAVLPQERYDIEAVLLDCAPPKGYAALVTLRFETVAGAAIEMPELPVSARVGPYRYLIAEGDRAAKGQRLRAAVTAPPGAARLHLELLRWSGGASLAGLQVTPQGTPDRVIAEGRFACFPDRAAILEGWLHAPGPAGSEAARLEVAPFDAEGHMIETGLPGFRATTRFAASLPLIRSAERPDWLRIAVVLEPPQGTAELRWRLHLPPGSVTAPPELEAPLRLTEISTDPAQLIAALEDRKRNIAPTLKQRAAALHEALPKGAVWTALALGDIALLAETLTPVKSGGWVVFTGEVSMTAGTETLADDLLLHPIFLDAEGRFLGGARPIGCITMPPVDPARPVTPRSTGNTYRYREAVLAPEGAAMVFGLLLGLAGGEVSISNPNAEMDDVDAIGQWLDDLDLDVGLAGQRALIALTQVADRIGHGPARLALAKARALTEPDLPAHPRAISVLEERLCTSWPDWWPDLPPRAPFSGDPDRVLLLASDWGAGSVEGQRACAEARALRDAGRAPVVCLPLAPGMPAGQDGLLESHEDGVPIVRPTYAGFDPARMSEAQCLRLDALFGERVARQQGCGMVQVLGDGGTGRAQVGVALARGLKLPLIQVPRGAVSEIAAGDLDECDVMIRRQREKERLCLEAADAVMVTSASLEKAFRKRGVASGRLYLVPEAQIAGAAEDAVRIRGYLRAGDGPMLGTAPGLVPGPELEILLKAVALAVREVKGMTLVLPTREAKRQALRAAAAQHGLAGILRLPHSPGSDWPDLAEIMLALPDQDASHAPAPGALQAMLRSVPVILPDDVASIDLLRGAQRPPTWDGRFPETLAARIVEAAHGIETLRKEASKRGAHLHMVLSNETAAGMRQRMLEDIMDRREERA